MSYTVIKFFKDSKDGRYTYQRGDKFPRNGLVVSDERLNELSSESNRQKTPLIKKDEFDNCESGKIKEVKETKTYTKTEINRMSTSDLQSLAIELGIKNAENTSGAELKKVLIELMEL